MAQKVWCHVLECAGRDKLWLDCDRNCALLARETFDANTGVLRQRLELRNHREIQPGIWVPLTIRNIQFEADPPTAEGRPRKSRDALFRVLDVRLNDQVGPEMFEFTPRPRAVRMFEEGRYVQASPGGWDHLDFLVDWMRRNAQFSISSRQLSTHSRRAIWDYAVIFAATLVILVFSR